MRRYLLLVPSDWNGAQIQGYMEQLPRYYGEAEFVDMRTWYKDNFSRLGTKESWVYDTVHGKQVDNRQPYFDGFIVPNLIDKTAHAIAAYALSQNRAVNCEGYPVLGFEQNENNSFSIIA
jgi:hypothetical protein